ncbi:MAG: hypothetical protein ACRELG_19730 [Gemmataceae bacterium]
MNSGSFCKNCGTPIPGESSDDPSRRQQCPKCGSIDRDFKMIALPGVFAVTGHEATLTYISYPEKLLEAAKGLINQDEFSIAVVVAHMACEISVQRALSRAFNLKGMGHVEEPIDDLLPSYNLANDRLRKLYNAVTGDEIQKQTFWQKYKQSARRRNKAVHEGSIATASEARDSFSAASSLVAYLK